MRNIDERLKRVQEQQGARQDDVQKGRVRIERPERESPSSEDKKKADA
jgi:hypothetical protein